MIANFWDKMKFEDHLKTGILVMFVRGLQQQVRE